MAHILFVYKQLPAPSVGHAGGESLFSLMQGLHQRGHRLTLVARIQQEEQAQLAEVQAICDRVFTVPHHRALPGPLPLALVKSYWMLRRTTARVLKELRPDFVHVETTQTAAILYGLRLPTASFRTQDVNWFLQQQQVARSRGWARLKAQVKQTFFKWFEPQVWHTYDVLLAISEGDRQLLAPHCRNQQLLLLPLSPAMQPAPGIAPAVTSGPNLVFVGAMSRDHNINGVLWFLDKVWADILAAVPETRLYIVGASPPDEIRARADEASAHAAEASTHVDEASAYANGASVFVTGFVDDLAPWYRAATVFVSPMLVAGGMLQKVMDAMAMGVPVVATSVCNHGLNATPGEHLLTADTPERFAGAVVRLLRDADARAQIGAAGQQFIEERYDIESAIDRWEQTLLKARLIP